MISQVERWARYVKENPSDWKVIHTRFINSQFEKQSRFLKRILRTKEGKDKLRRLYKIQNMDAVEGLLGSP